MKVSRKILLIGTSVLFIFITLGYFGAKEKKASAYTGCTIITNKVNPYNGGTWEWDTDGYHYEVWGIGAQANGDPTAAQTGNGEYFNTAIPGDGSTGNSCSNGGVTKVFMTKFAWVNGQNNPLPIEARLGVSGSLHPNGGVWAPTVTTSTHSTLAGVYSSNFGRPAGEVDDAGRIKFGNTQVMCAGMGDCGYDSNVLTEPNRNGAGFLFVSDNCPSGSDGAKTFNCSDASNFSWYGGITNYTPLMDTNGNGRLDDATDNFQLNVEAKNTHDVGFSAMVYVTFKYPLPTYQHKATLGPCSTDTPTVIAGSTTISCNPGMENDGSADGPQTFVEFYEYSQHGADTDNVLPTPPLPGQPQDSKLTAFYGYQTSALKSGDGTQPHYLWVRSSTPRYSYPDYAVQYQPAKFKVKAGTPAGTQLCFITQVTADPYGPTDHVSSPRGNVCYIVGGAGGSGTPGPGPNPTDTPACATANPSIPAFPSVTVSLPDQAPSSAAPSGSSGSPGQTQIQDTPDGKTQVTAVTDISSGGSRTPPPKTSESYQQAVLDYSPYVSNYLYDFNQASVTYDSYYTETTWHTSSSPSGYTCGGGDSLSGSTCSHSEPQPPTCGANHKSACPPKITTYGGTPYYNWGSAGSTTKTKSNTVNAANMNPCYDRAFQSVTPTTTAPLFDDEEQPSKVTFVANTSVNMYLPTPPGNRDLRSSLRVKLDVNANYYIKHANGTTSAFSEGRQTNVLSASNIMFDSGQTVPNTYSQGFTDIFNAHIPPLTAGDKACVVISVGQTQGRMTVAGDRTSASGSASTSEACSEPLVNKPYFKVFGGDVIAGGAFTGGDCSQTGSVSGFYNLIAAAGASNQFAAQSIGQITEFGTAQLRDAGTPTRPLGLSLANSGTNTSYPAMGGNFGGSHCITDYWATKPSAAAAQPTDSYNNVAGASGAVYIVPPSGTATISGGSNITGSKTIYIDGNAVLSGDFSYAGSTAWASPNSIPSLFIIAKGNIYVDAGVGQLDGVYVAEPSNILAPANGKIYTCANGTTPVSLNTVFSTCSKQLTINGAFIANQVKLLRTTGSLRNATSGEQLSSAPHSCSPSGQPSAPVCAAEIFNFSPEIYLAQPSLPLIRSAYQGKYDYITSLPPLL